MITPDYSTDKTLDTYDPKNPVLQMHPAPATNPTAQSLFGPAPWITNAGGYNSFSGWAAYNSLYFATQETADKLAKMLGGTVVDDPNLNEGPFAGGHPALLIEMPSGVRANAGILANYWAHNTPLSWIEKCVSDEIGTPWKFQAEPPPPVAPPPVPPVDHVLPPGAVGTRLHADPPSVDGFDIGYSATRQDGSAWLKGIGYTPFGTIWFWECVQGAS